MAKGKIPAALKKFQFKKGAGKTAGPKKSMPAFLKKKLGRKR